MIKPEVKLVAVQAVGGLEVESQERLRAPNSWRRLENWDLFVPGSVRKIEGYSLVNTQGSFVNFVTGLPDEIQSIHEHRRLPTDPPYLLCLGKSGGIYVLDQSLAIHTAFAPVDYPFVAMMSGLGDGISSPSGTPNPARQILYMVVTPESVRPQKWDGIPAGPPVTAPTPLGVSAPTLPAEVKFALVTDGIIGAPKDQLDITNPVGLELLASRGYAWTYWDPKTMHESSLSPTTQDSYFVVADSQDALATYPQIIQIRVYLPVEAPDNPAYTRRRLYATRDGGQTFFLVQGLQWTDASLNLFQADSDDSIPLSVTEILDGDPALTEYVLVHKNVAWLVTPESPTPADETIQQLKPVQQLAQTQANGLLIHNGTTNPNALLPKFVAPSYPPTQDVVLVQPSPLEGENDPPPIAVWGAVYQNRLWLMPRDDDSKVVFSKVGDFQSFPRDNFFDFPESNYDPVKALVPSYIQMLIGKIRSITSLSGTSFLDFSTYPLDEHVGFIGHRSNVMVEGKVFYMSQQGVQVFEGNKAEFVGGPIRTITDNASRVETLKRVQFTVHMQRGMVLCHIANVDGRDSIFIYDLSMPASPWTEITYLPGKLGSLQTVLLPQTETEAVLFSDMNGNVYELFSGAFAGVFPDNKPKPVVGTAETQFLPQDDPVSKKMFRRLYVELSDYDRLEYSYSVDGVNFSNPKTLKSDNYLGVIGQQIVIRFEHDADPQGKDITLENYTVEYVSIGPARYR